MAKALGEYVSPLIADMYQTALNLFPARTLEEMRVVIKEDSGDFRGGEGEQDGEKVPDDCYWHARDACQSESSSTDVVSTRYTARVP